jgi:hypothetical protein
MSGARCVTNISKKTFALMVWVNFRKRMIPARDVIRAMHLEQQFDVPCVLGSGCIARRVA